MLNLNDRAYNMSVAGPHANAYKSMTSCMVQYPELAVGCGVLAQQHARCQHESDCCQHAVIADMHREKSTTEEEC